LNHKWKYIPKKERPEEHKKDYFVPNFGTDPEISETNDSEKQAEAQVWSQRLAG